MLLRSSSRVSILYMLILFFFYLGSLVVVDTCPCCPCILAWRTVVSCGIGFALEDHKFTKSSLKKTRLDSTRRDATRPQWFPFSPRSEYQTAFILWYPDWGSSLHQVMLIDVMNGFVWYSLLGEKCNHHGPLGSAMAFHVLRVGRSISIPGLQRIDWHRSMHLNLEILKQQHWLKSPTRC